ncbi:related to long chain fatty alcohol oxidase [Cephalotrichum gorgonifer]|uniref:Long-chain-alcohol oxidase n=1 Tax=Cephalotrichum gorgonifer TaxID=2041049 RepID=A0AAE8SVG1_9PEZI|nr:related to long chain fatty alcohol oxidase [Cephalotrichum gorgonifer]
MDPTSFESVAGPAPSPPALSSLPSTDFWDETQWAVLLAIMEAAVPAIASESTIKDKHNQIRIPDAEFENIFKRVENTVADPPSKETLRDFLEERCTTDLVYIDTCKRTLCSFPPEAKRRLGGILKLLTYRIGAFVLTGYCTPFHQLPVHIRASIMRSWRTARLPFLPVLSRSIQALAQKCYFQTNRLHQLTGYTDAPQGYKPGDAYDFQFIQFPPGDGPAVVEADVVIVGSGPGGAVCAKAIAEAGYRVVIVDKGYYFPPSQLPMTQAKACDHLYEGQSVVGPQDNSAIIVAGSCWGGGGTVNWSVSLQTQQFVREEWATEHGLPFFTSPQFQECLERVSDTMGVSDKHMRHNHGAKVILDGAAKLGWKAAAAPQNTGGNEHFCGRCHLGCGSNEKKGPAASYLPAAARAGARFVEGFQVDRVLFDESDGSKKATGVVGRWVARNSEGGFDGPLEQKATRKVIVKAAKVIVSCGSLWSPVVLKKSGLENPNIGTNLHIHPVNHVVARFKEETKPWEGGIITSYCSEFENLDNAGHGVKIETTCMVPYAILSPAPFVNGLEARLAALNLRHMSGFISLVRDRDSGTVTVDPSTGRPRIQYTPSDFDSQNALEGVVAIAKLCYVSGATEIHPYLPWLEPFVRGEGTEGGEYADDPAFLTWLERVREVGNKPPIATWTSAHQMGTCRMGSSPKASVVDGKGKVWGCEGLYVADSSVFPSASGVNPMLTVMAIADWIGAGVVEDLGQGQGSK